MRTVSRSGFGLIEATLATVIAGGVMVVGINAIASAVVIKRKAAERDRARLLALDLATEALRLPYEDPVQGVGVVPGPGADEVTGTRSMFDDVDDYHGWTASPPQYKDGSVMSGLPGWRRSLAVRRVDAGTLATSASDTGVIELTVTVERHGSEIARVVALRTSSWDVTP